MIDLDRVTRPSELASAPLRGLLDGYEAHVGALVNARHGIGRPQPVDRLRGAALDMLAIEQAIANQILAARWVTVADALTFGATIDHVAIALDLDASEVVAGLCSWADGRLRLNDDTAGQLGITPAQHTEVRALVERRSA